MCPNDFYCHIVFLYHKKEMKKIRNVENPFEFETVVFSFSEEQILRELIAESSYVAKSLVGQSDLKSGWSRSIIFPKTINHFFPVGLPMPGTK